MSRSPSFAMLTALAALLAAPAMAQTTPPPSGATANGNTGYSGTATVAPNSQDHGNTAGADNNAGIAAAPANTGGANTRERTTPTAPALANNPPATNRAGKAGPPTTAAGVANPLLAQNGQARASKVVGTDVYNEQDQNIGSIDDILMDQKGEPKSAIISVGGFLGIGAKLVEVPYDKLQFGDTRKNGDNKILMPGASKDELKGMPSFSYDKGVTANKNQG